MRETFRTKNGSTTLLRTATYTDAPTMGLLASKTYQNHPLTAFLSPRRFEFWDDYVRGFRQRCQDRLLDPRCLSIVVVVADPRHLSQTGNPDGDGDDDTEEIIAFAQFRRQGNDAFADALVEENWSLKGMLKWWWVWGVAKVGGIIWRDRTEIDGAARREFLMVCERDDKVYWGEECYKERWHAQSVVVGDEWQGLGIGRKMMGVVLERAGRENVIVKLEASSQGETLYRRLGFEMRGILV